MKIGREKVRKRGGKREMKSEGELKIATVTVLLEMGVF